MVQRYISERQSYWLLLDVVEVIRVGVHNLAFNLVCPAAVVSQAAGCSSNVALGHAEGLAIVQRLNSGEKVGVLIEEVGELDEVLATVTWSDLLPLALECLASS